MNESPEPVQALTAGGQPHSGYWRAPYSGHRDSVELMFMEMFGWIRQAETCGHPDRPLVIEACRPHLAMCLECLAMDPDRIADCFLHCAVCGARLPVQAGRPGRSCDVAMASAGGITLAGAFCRKCARIVKELVPCAKPSTEA